MKCLFTTVPEGEDLKAFTEKILQIIAKNGPFEGGWYLLLPKPLEDIQVFLGIELKDTPWYVFYPNQVVAKLPAGKRAQLMEHFCEPAGSIKLANGFTIGYCNLENPSEADVALVTHQRLDFLITHATPAGISDSNDNEPLAHLYDLVRTRYHFVPGRDFYERPPFQVDSEHQTRFIVLGNGRWHYAINTTPNAPSLPSPNCTANPFRVLKEHDVAGRVEKKSFFFGIDEVPSEQQTAEYLAEMRKGATSKGPPVGYSCRHCKSALHYFRDCPYKLAVSDTPLALNQPPAGYICHACRQPGHLIKFCPERHKPAASALVGQKREREEDRDLSCWFCLANPTVKKHLIVEVGEEVYLARPRGAFDSTHCLLIPVEHVTVATAKVLEETQRWHGRLRAALQQPIVVSRMMRPCQHHWTEQVIAVPQNFTVEVAKAFILKSGFKLTESQNDDHYEVIIDGLSLRIALPGNCYFPVNFVRQMFAEHLGQPVEDWRQVVAGKDLYDDEVDGVRHIRNLLDGE